MSVSLTLRSTKGSPLTHDEVDANFTALAAPAELPANLGFFKPSVGRVFTNAILATTSANMALTTTHTYLAPILVPFDCTVDEIGINVTTAIATAKGKVSLYRSDADNRPDALIEECAEIDMSGTGVKQSTLSSPVALSKGEVVWGGLRDSIAGVVVSGPQLYNSLTIDFAYNSVSPGKFTRRTSIPYATALPANWGYLDAELVSSIAPHFLFRIAS